MDDDSRMDIRKLLKTFGVQADEAVIKHLLLNPSTTPIRLRLTLTDLTDYGDEEPADRLSLVVEGEVRRG